MEKWHFHMENRPKYVVMIGLGFTIAVLIGLWLAFQVAAGYALLEQLSIALIGFVPSALLAGYGTYQYIQAGEEPDEIPLIDVRQQRELVDLIHERGMITITEAAQVLDISERDVKDAIRQLFELEIFTGYVDWDNNVVYSQRTKRLK